MTGPGAASGDDPGAVPPAGGATVTLTGTSFGPDVALVAVTWGAQAVATVSLVTPHAAISFVSLPGEGEGVNVTVTVAGQATARAVRIPFAAPRVTLVQLDRTTDPAASIDCRGAGDDGRPVGVPGPQQRAVVVIRGVNFGRGNATVAAVRAAPCTLLAPVEDTRIVCWTPYCSGAESWGCTRLACFTFLGEGWA